MGRLTLLATALTLVLVACYAEAAGSRRGLLDARVAAAPSQMTAGAPAPGAGKPPADILFTFSAREATLADNVLMLTGPAPVALHTTSGMGVGTTPLGEFANATSGALYVDSAGHWLANPVAVLVGMNGGASAKALVRLSSPRLAANSSALTFQAAILAADSEEALPYAGGVTARLVDDKANGLASGLLTGPATLTNAALFIDANSGTIGPQAQSKFFGLFWGPWWGGPGWGPGWGGGYGRGYDGYGWGGGGWGHGGYWGK